MRTTVVVIGGNKAERARHCRQWPPSAESTENEGNYGNKKEKTQEKRGRKEGGEGRGGAWTRDGVQGTTATSVTHRTRALTRHSPPPLVVALSGARAHAHTHTITHNSWVSPRHARTRRAAQHHSASLSGVGTHSHTQTHAHTHGSGTIWRFSVPPRTRTRTLQPTHTLALSAPRSKLRTVPGTHREHLIHLKHFMHWEQW